MTTEKYEGVFINYPESRFEWTPGELTANVHSTIGSLCRQLGLRLRGSVYPIPDRDGYYAMDFKFKRRTQS